MSEPVTETSFEMPGAASATFPKTVIRGTSFSSGPSEQTLIVCHGFKGFKDWGFFPHLGRVLARDGFSVLTFNFSHGGVGAGLFDHTELDRFQANTFSLEIKDLELVLAAVRAGNIPAVRAASAIGLIGHSRGGAAVLAVGAKDPGVRAVATLASIAKMVEVTSDEEKSWREAGVVHVENKRTGQQMPLGIELLEDMLIHRALIEGSARTLSKPLLIIHGTADETVPYAAAERLSTWAPSSKVILLDQADHTFGIKHPFSGTTAHLDLVLEELSRFFRNALSSRAAQL